MVDLFGKGMLGWVGRPGLTERGISLRGDRFGPRIYHIALVIQNS